MLARYGGEEFGMLLMGTAAPQALELAQELRHAVAALGFHFKGTPVAVTSSCGITELRADDTPATAFGRADGGLCGAKHAGRNRCVVS